MPILSRPALMRGVVMGRREDGAAAGTRPEIRPDLAGSMTGETPPSIDAAPRASEKRAPRLPGDGGAPLPGIRTRRQELADRRGWSTFSKARPVLVAERRMWSAGRRLSPIARRKETPSHGVSGGLAGRPGSLARSRVSRRSAPLVGERGIGIRTRACPGPTQKYGRWRLPVRHPTFENLHARRLR